MKVKQKSNIFAQLRILKWVFFRDMIETGHVFRRELFDALFWPIKFIILFSYLLPGLGRDTKFGPFILVGAVVTTSIFAIFRQANTVLEDIQYSGVIYYQVNLSVSSLLLFLEKILVFLIRAFTINILVYIVGTALIISEFKGIPISIFKALFILFAINFICGSVSLMASSLKNVRNVYHTNFSPALFTLWDFGCYIYSWETVLGTVPILAYMMVFNPIVYMMEGFRAAVLGQAGFINYWICLLLLLGCGFLIMYIATKKMRARLDCF